MINAFRSSFLGVIALVTVAAPVCAQSIEDLNLQFHGYATQSFLYTTKNNILTANSSDGSPAWTEAVVNLSALPQPKLRISLQVRYSIIGQLGNAFTLDYAAAEYKVNDRFGVRFGKVKTPSSLYNTQQDIDPSYMWSLLPQSVYPVLSRNSLLANFGGLAFGTIPLGEKFGKLVYAGYGGQISLASNDGFIIPIKDAGFGAPNGYGETLAGGSLRWKTPIPGLLIGAANSHDFTSSVPITYDAGLITGTFAGKPFNNQTFSASYDHNKFSVASEYTRIPFSALISLPAPFPYPHVPYSFDNRGWYGMASYKITGKWAAGLYNSQFFNHAAAKGPARYSKDWALSTRYDFNEYLYAKAEQHWIDGTAVLYDTWNNTGGLQPDTHLTILKMGVSF